jgi:DNA-binding transcriptional LysR family regulator
MDRYAAMAIFVKVVDGSSFAGAARHFRISPAVVSKHVQALETRLGVRLLHRTTRRVTPTEVGLTYYQNCLRILADVEESERAAGNLNATPRGILKVSAPFSFGIAHVAPAIADYLAAHADVSVELVLNDRVVDLLEEGFDLAIRIGELPDSTLIARRLTDTRAVLCASPQYLQRHGEPRGLDDLAGHNCLVYSLSGARGGWHFLDSDGREEAVPASGRFVANNGDALRVLALRGGGIARLPIFVVADDLAAGRLVRLLPQYEAKRIPVHAVYPHGQFLSAKVRSFVEFIAARFAGMPADGAATTERQPERGTRRLRAI